MTFYIILYLLWLVTLVVALINWNIELVQSALTWLFLLMVAIDVEILKGKR